MAADLREIQIAYRNLYREWSAALDLGNVGDDDDLIRQMAADHLTATPADEIIEPNKIVSACLVILAARAIV